MWVRVRCHVENMYNDEREFALNYIIIYSYIMFEGKYL